MRNHFNHQKHRSASDNSNDVAFALLIRIVVQKSFQDTICTMHTFFLGHPLSPDEITRSLFIIMKNMKAWLDTTTT